MPPQGTPATEDDVRPHPLTVLTNRRRDGFALARRGILYSQVEGVDQHSHEIEPVVAIGIGAALRKNSPKTKAVARNFQFRKPNSNVSERGSIGPENSAIDLSSGSLNGRPDREFHTGRVHGTAPKVPYSRNFDPVGLERGEGAVEADHHDPSGVLEKDAEDVSPGEGVIFQKPCCHHVHVPVEEKGHGVPGRICGSLLNGADQSHIRLFKKRERPFDSLVFLAIPLPIYGQTGGDRLRSNSDGGHRT